MARWRRCWGHCKGNTFENRRDTATIWLPDRCRGFLPGESEPCWRSMPDSRLPVGGAGYGSAVSARWSVDQVLALAPDPASAAAGRKLAHREPWSDIGTIDELVWGCCAGSGKAPYQTIVD